MIADVTDHTAAVLEAVSTAVAAVFAIVASFFAYRAYLKESRIEKRLRDTAEQEQASKVAAWIDAYPRGSGSEAVLIRNASQVPIYDVTCRVLTNDGVNALPTVAVVPPSPESGAFNIQLPTRRVGGDKRSQREFPVSVVFTDASGVEWRRQYDGVLRRRNGTRQDEDLT